MKKFPQSKRRKGIYRKFCVVRTDGKSEPGKKHADCEYFVLDLDHDPFAIPAIKAYAEACRKRFPILASDLISKAVEIASRE